MYNIHTQVQEYVLSRSVYYPGVCTIQECVLSRSVYYPGVCTIQKCVLSRSVYYPGVCTIQEYVLSRSVYYPGVCTIQECVLSRSVYYPGVCTIHECVLSRSVYYPGVCTIQECVLSRSVYYPGVCTIQEGVLCRSMHYPGVCTNQECPPGSLSRTCQNNVQFHESKYTIPSRTPILQGHRERQYFKKIENANHTTLTRIWTKESLITFVILNVNNVSKPPYKDQISNSSQGSISLDLKLIVLPQYHILPPPQRAPQRAPTEGPHRGPHRGPPQRAPTEGPHRGPPQRVPCNLHMHKTCELLKHIAILKNINYVLPVQWIAVFSGRRALRLSWPLLQQPGWIHCQLED